MIVIGNIRDRRNELLARRDEAVAALRSLGAREDTPLLLAVNRCADDISALVAEVDRLASQPADTDLRKALIGILRADGYRIEAPEAARITAEVVNLVHEAASDEFENERNHIVPPASAPFSNRVPVEPEPPPSYRTAPPGTLGPGDYGPDSFGGQDAPYASAVVPPKQPTLFQDDDTATPHRGAIAIVCGDSPHAGRSVMLHEQRGHSWTAELLSRHVQITKTIPMNASTLILDGFPDPDAPKLTVAAPFAEPKSDAAQEKPGRSPETAKPVAEWVVTDKDIADMAQLTGRTVDELKRLLAKFKEDEAKSPPQVRWRPRFTPWAKSDAATKFLASA